MSINERSPFKQALALMASGLLVASFCACSLLAALPAGTASRPSIPASSAAPAGQLANPSATPSSSADNNEEQSLFRLINAYRVENKLPAIPQSNKLMLTARTHVQDLLKNSPQLQKASDGTECNLHSWSAKGSWTPVCYTADHREAEKMWSKPREIAAYSGNGYEIAAQAGTCQKAECLLDIWKNSPAHNQVMINQAIWADTTWRAMGVGISGQFAVVWFGKESD